MNGGPSHVDTFDPKPELSKWHGKVLPDEHRLNTERKTGARGLRAVLEETMLDIMYDLPSQPEVEEVIISDEVVLNGEKPMLVYENKKQAS